MGIRYYCNACDRKIHVKSFLAGKRGICPHCGASQRIPNEDEVSPDAKREVLRVTAEGGEAASSGYAAATVAAGQSSVATPVVAVKALAPVASAVPSAVPTARPVAPSSPPAEKPATPDPIDEAPSAVWYVRPPSGGQFGPAAADIMRKWIGEGRVSADSLVWREGWAEWQTAGPLFPSLGAKSTPPAPDAVSRPDALAVTPTSYSLGQTSTAVSRLRPRRRNSNTIAIGAIAVLAILSVALAVVLIVLMNR